MAEPTDEQLLAEAERLKQEDAKKRLPIWPFFYCVLPILLALGLIVFVNRPSNNDGRQNKINAVPDLGAQGRPLVKPPADGEKPTDSPTDGVKEPAKDGDKVGKADGSKDGEKQPDPPVEAKPVSDFEIEIAIRNISNGVKNNDPRTVSTAQRWLRDNAKNGPVAERITTALGSEQNARIRLALFQAFADDKAALDWALNVFRSRSAKFGGTDTSFAEGELDELSLYLETLLSNWESNPTVLDFTRTMLNQERPEWALRVLVFSGGRSDLFDAVSSELEALLRRKTLNVAILEQTYGVWAESFGAHGQTAPFLDDPAFYHYLPVLLKFFGEFDRKPDPFRNNGIWMFEPVPVLNTVSAALQSPNVDQELKARIIDGLARPVLQGEKSNSLLLQIIDAGLKRKDSNYPDYLILVGRIYATVTNLDLLRAAANDSKPEVARGAIKGLKDAPAGEAADVRLKEILNEGTNDGVKADAFAALIERNPRDAQKLVDEYIDPAKPVTLRVVAVAHVPAKDVERLQDLAQDEQLKVRQAAINRLGALKDKKLLSFLKRVSTHDTSPVLRQLAAKYAAELE